MLGSNSIKSWSQTQALIALSSGESEFYATLKASAETLGTVSMLNDYGVNVTAEVWGDAQAAPGITHRKRVGKTCNIQTRLLWIQQMSAEKRLKFGKSLGKVNPADLFTKYFDQTTIEQHVAKLAYTFEGGRALEAPKLHNVSISIDEYELLGKYTEWEWLQLIKNSIQHENKKTWKQKKRKL